jgi:hypothetical protein
MTATKTQNKTQHTPGPWRIGTSDREQGYTMYYLENTQGAEFGAETESNARLIAAAPEMLDALRFVSEFYQLHFDVMPVAFQTFADIVDTAIAKAEGRDWATPRPTR